MKQSTLFSLVGSGKNHVTPSLSKSKSNSTSADKENVALKADIVVVSVTESGDSKADVVDILENDPIVEINNDRSPGAQLQKSEEKQVISYEDFIKSGPATDLSETDSQSSNKTVGGAKSVIDKAVKPSPCQNRRTSHSHDEGEGKTESGLIMDGEMNKQKSSKQSVSYQDFLGLFKPASVSDQGDINSHGVEVVSEQDNADTIEDDELLLPAKSETVKSKSITSFFKPKSKDKIVPKGRKTQGSSTFTVTAEVHITPPSESEEESPQKRPRTKMQQHDRVNSRRNSKTTAKVNHDEIVLISSAVDVSSSETKKRKLENVNTKKGAHIGLQLKKKKTSTESTQEVKCLIKEGHDASRNANTGKRSSGSGQCTLSFGASGLTVTKEKTKCSMEDKSVDETLAESSDRLLPIESQESVNPESKKSSKSRLKLKSLAKVAQHRNDKDNEDLKAGDRKVQQVMLDTSSNDSTDSHRTTDQEHLETNSDSDTFSTETRKRKSGRLRLRQSKVDESKDKLKSKDPVKVEIEKDESNKLSTANVNVVHDEGTSTPSLRRSSRIKHNAETTKKVEEIEVISDDCESNKKSSRKGAGQRKCGDVLEQSSNKTDGSGSSKAQRRLAPIFARLKQTQPEPVKPPPPPTPEELEKLRARREFLMSGIPDELKRAKAALDLQMLPEYPPFPCPSHVCQLEESTIKGRDNDVPKEIAIRSINPDLGFSDLCDMTLDWSSLGWKKHVARQTEERRKLLFRDFSSHPLLDRRQTNALLQELRSTDKTFPFREALDQFVAAKGATQLKENLVSTNEDDVIVVDDVIPSGNVDIVPGKSSSSTNGVLWTDQHPASSQHFVGNGKSFSQLRDWLKQWQEELRKEARRAIKGAKSAKDSKKRARDWSDDSDFTDSSEEDCGLVNTVLVTGPHGVGKTSTVYCLAREMGFKVFEVNPTSLRSGKQLQSQLEEATQSHRVAHSGPTSSGMFGTPPAGTPKPKPVQEIPKPSVKPPVCKAFSTFFKASNQSSKPASKKAEGKGKPVDVVVEDKKKEEKKKGSMAPASEKKRGRRKKDEEAPVEVETSEKGVGTTDVINPLNISSSSIILFDEADVVLEEDKGFLSTVQHFMSSTKIPIIITATHPAIHSELSPRHEHIVLRRPPVKTVSSFLHTVCLERGVRVDHASLTRLVSALKQDIRQCLLFMQFWCESGGGRSTLKSDSVLCRNSRRSESPNRKSIVSSNVGGGGNVLASDSSNDSDFLSLRPARKRRRLVCLDDDDEESLPDNSKFSKSGVSSAPAEVCDRTTQETGTGNSNIGGGNEEALTLPLVHACCDASLVGGHSLRDIQSVIIDLIKEPLLDINGAVNEINHLQSHLPSNLIYNAALHCCPLAKTDPLPVRLEIEAPKNNGLPVKKRKRIMVGDWLDSEGSDDDSGGGVGSTAGLNADAADGGDSSISDGASVSKDCVKDDVTGNKNGESNDVSDCTNDGNGDAFVHKDGESDNASVVHQSNQNDVAADEDSLSPSDKESCDEIDNVNNRGETEDSIALNTNIKDTVVKSNSKEKKCLSSTSKYLNVLSNFYENNSSVQSLYHASGVFDRKENELCILPGFSDEEVLKGDTDFESHRVLSEDILGCVKLLSARTLMNGVTVCQDKDEEVEEESGRLEEVNCLPVGTEMPNVWTLEKTRPDIGNDSSTKNIASCVGSGGRGSGSSLHLDYMPMLREMCRFEHQRQLTNAKRRFNHYLDYIGMNVRDSTRISLASTYSIARH